MQILSSLFFKASSHSLSLPPNVAISAENDVSHIRGTGWKVLSLAEHPSSETSSDLTRFKLVLSSHLPIFKEGDSPSHIYQMMWCCRVQVPKLMDAVVEEAGSTYSPK